MPSDPYVQGRKIVARRSDDNKWKSGVPTRTKELEQACKSLLLQLKRTLSIVYNSTVVVTLWREMDMRNWTWRNPKLELCSSSKCRIKLSELFINK